MKPRFPNPPAPRTRPTLNAPAPHYGPCAKSGYRLPRQLEPKRRWQSPPFGFMQVQVLSASHIYEIVITASEQWNQDFSSFVLHKSNRSMLHIRITIKLRLIYLSWFVGQILRLLGSYPTRKSDLYRNIFTLSASTMAYNGR